MGISRDDLVDDLGSIGLHSGDCVALGVSLREVGWLDDGPAGLVEAVLSVVGTQGTVFIPTFTRMFPLPLSAKASARLGGISPADYVFDPASTPPITGSVPKAILAMPGCMRSRHPTSSIGAIGKEAAGLTLGHDETSPAYWPYSRLAELRGKLLCIGIGGNLVGLRHQAQYLTGLLTILPPTMGVKYLRKDGTTGLFVRKDKGGCTKRLPELNNVLASQGLLESGRIGEAESLLVQASGALEALAELLSKDPSINLCRDYRCLWCREIERRLGLVHAVEDPRIFQRSGLVQRLGAGVNALRLRNSRWAEQANRAMAYMMNLAEGIAPPKEDGQEPAQEGL